MAVTLFKRTSRLIAGPSRRVRIAYLTESYTMGGVERETTILLGHLDRTRFEPVLICGHEPGIAEFVAEVHAMGVQVSRTNLLSVGRRRSALIRIFALRRFLRQQRIDVLHLQVLGGTGAKYIQLAAWLAGVPVIVKTLHGAALHRLPWLTRCLVNAADR